MDNDNINNKLKIRYSNKIDNDNIKNEKYYIATK